MSATSATCTPCPAALARRALLRAARLFIFFLGSAGLLQSPFVACSKSVSARSRARPTARVAVVRFASEFIPSPRRKAQRRTWKASPTTLPSVSAAAPHLLASFARSTACSAFPRRLSAVSRSAFPDASAPATTWCAARSASSALVSSTVEVSPAALAPRGEARVLESGLKGKLRLASSRT
eukprot:scaffold1661_cov251-Pinguiococcus_pyrenoidosus.AAC.30